MEMDSEKNFEVLTLRNLFNRTEADGMKTQRGCQSKQKDINPVDDKASVNRGRDGTVTSSKPNRYSEEGDVEIM